MKTNNKLNKANSYRLSQELLRNKALSKGVNLIAPETIFLSQDTSFGKNVTVEPYVVFGPKVKVGDNSHIKSFTHIEGTKIEKNVAVGPYARLRPGTILKKNTKIGNFVETKKSNINQNSKVIIFFIVIALLLVIALPFLYEKKHSRNTVKSIESKQSNGFIEPLQIKKNNPTVSEENKYDNINYWRKRVYCKTSN